MEPFRVHILGCGSALPTLHHNASAQVVEIRGKLFLVDCGEGTQVQLRRSRLRFTKISAVFITHLHGDHCFGLIGMLSTFGLLGRTARLAIYAPAALEAMLKQQMQLFCHDFDYEVEPSLPHIRRDMIDFYEIPTSQINNIKAGADWTTPDGEVVKNERLVEPADPVRSYAYCSDTRYIPTLHERIKGVSTLYHESTYGEDNLLMAQKYYHSTARQAALVAREAGVGQLLLGHYSSRYEDEQVLLREAQEVFENTRLTDENAIFDV